MAKYFDVHMIVTNDSKDGYSIFVKLDDDATEQDAIAHVTNNKLYEDEEDLKHIDYVGEITENDYMAATNSDVTPTLVKAYMTFESKNPEELTRMLDHHMEYLINFDDVSDVISSVANVMSYEPTARRDVPKLNILADILHDILDEEPSDEELDDNDDAIALYDELHNLKMALETMGLY